jgi:hypothetical protein
VTGAIALAILLVVAVAGVSMALQGQPGAQSPSQRQRPAPRAKVKRSPDAPPAPPSMPREPEVRGPDLLRSGVAAEAKVLSVVDERTTGPVTRSRLTLEIEPEGGTPFEVTVRFAFPTPQSRSGVKVGGRIPVRYDKDDRTKVVVDLPPA